ncbi:hypothetical protein B9X71_07785 [Acinetobacter baumannii]|uniref:hypothetical protein n=1 Tax=Acinetobacter baumannii TaxID=470 RepID=UPI000A348329|nr:hypothetical protein [Acinetobacter baumannii]MCT9166202.1 hypothetical protein [Acinetobacter baumannii]MCT9173603.1 hypothetical protein [Acinetobacter baumannii]MCT9179964.1 hypothetical protein [Acinetobacter baumannii]OTK48156.1 hypothetical protein B9X71_07785 [Acinetobacter baumannii]
MAKPYNFMRKIDHWAEVINTIELLIAVRNGMGYKEDDPIINEFQQTAFKIIFLIAFANVEFLILRTLSKLDHRNKFYRKIEDLKEKFSKLDAISASVELTELRQNNGPLFINREMFKKVFNQDYNTKVVQIMKENREYNRNP